MRTTNPTYLFGPCCLLTRFSAWRLQCPLRSLSSRVGAGADGLGSAKSGRAVGPGGVERGSTRSGSPRRGRPHSPPFGCAVSQTCVNRANNHGT